MGLCSPGHILLCTIQCFPQEGLFQVWSPLGWCSRSVLAEDQSEEQPWCSLCVGNGRAEHGLFRKWKISGQGQLMVGEMGSSAHGQDALILRELSV